MCPADISFTRRVTAAFNEHRRPQTEQRFVSSQITEASLWPFAFHVRPPQQMTEDDPFYSEGFFFFSFPPFPLSRFTAPRGNHLRKQPQTVKKTERGRR